MLKQCETSSSHHKTYMYFVSICLESPPYLQEHHHPRQNIPSVASSLASEAHQVNVNNNYHHRVTQQQLSP